MCHILVDSQQPPSNKERESAPVASKSVKQLSKIGLVMLYDLILFQLDENTNDKNDTNALVDMIDLSRGDAGCMMHANTVVVIGVPLK